MTGRLVDMAFTLGGKQRVTLEINGDFREIWDKLHQEPVLDVEMALRSSIKMPNWFGCGMTLKMLRAQSLTAMEPTLVYSAVQQVMPSTEF